MRVLISILLLIHGLIHLFGFLKAFGYAKFDAISQPISKPLGLIWLAAFILFLATLATFLSNKHYWFYIGFLALCISQILIIIYWSDAKFGTLANLIILIVVLIAYADFGFSRMVAQDTARIESNSNSRAEVRISKQELEDLPPPVRRWLELSGATSHPKIKTVSLRQKAEMRLKPDQEDWIPARASQYFTVDPPSFVWSVSMKMNSVIPVVGRDKFEEGKGSMLIKLFSIFPIVNEKDHHKINQATLQRFLGETVWFPSAALSPYITWEEIDSTSARATMSYQGTEGSGVFYFDENGLFKEFRAMRYKDMKEDERAEWIVRAVKTEPLNGISIPIEAEAEWQLEDGSSWKWLKLRIEDVSYD